MERLLSIVVPVYNAEKFLPDCIESILSQEYRNLELLLINDGSTDGSGKICDAYAQKDKRVKAYHILNSGAAVARNLGMDYATGEFVGFVDADDTVEPEMYRTMVESAQKSNADIVMCGFYMVIDGHKQRSVCIQSSESVLDGNEEVRNELLKRYYQGTETGLASMCNKLYRLDFLNENRFRMEEGKVRGEDYWLNFYALKKAERVVVLPVALYNYRQVNSSSVMHTFRQTYYKEYKEDISRLTEENATLGFSVGIGLYNAFAYKIQQHILEATKRKEKKLVLSILRDNFYQDRIAKAQVAKWCQIINWFVLKKRYHIAYWLYSVVAFCKGLRSN